MDCPGNLTYQIFQGISLLPAGAQNWNVQICDTNHAGKFAYASTLAVYVFEKDGNSYRLISVIHDHKETITCLCWHPLESTLIASYSPDPGIIIYDVNLQVTVYKIALNISSVVKFLMWPLNENSILCMNEHGPVQKWSYQGDNKLEVWLNEMFSSPITCFDLHVKDNSKIAFGHLDGSVSLRNPEKFIKHHTFVSGDKVKSKVKSVAWDPFSSSYMLVLSDHSSIKLIDVESMSTINTYLMPSSALSVQQLRWLPCSPGVFMTADESNGIIRVWSVSRKSPCDVLKLKDEGLHSFSLMKSNCFEMKMNYNNDCIYDAEILCVFNDGGVGVFTSQQKKWLYLQEAGHQETIFDCKWNPENSEILASCSFDGCVRLWELNDSFKLSTVKAYHSEKSPVYCISWAPGDLNCLAGASSRNGVFIWNIKKATIIQRFMDHGDQVVFAVAWNLDDSRKIASGGKSCCCIVHHVDGSIFSRFIHPDTVYGCDWKNSTILATACGDGIIRIFDMEDKKMCNLLKGHTAKVFRIQWNKVCQDILCSSSDDMSIRVWDTVKACCISVLSGHENKVRALAWCPAAPYLIISGSWDATIRMWDIRDKSCRDVGQDHQADIYGLSVHPDKPFLIASTSRDTTIRLWTFAPQFMSIYLDVLVRIDPPPPPAVITPSSLLDLEYDYYLCADAYSQVINSTCYEGRLKDLLCLFKPYRITANIWDLLSISSGESCFSRLSSNYSKGILHSKHMKKMIISEAQEISSSLSSSKGPKTAVEKSQMELLATKYLKAGHMKSYCDILLKLGKWEQACAVAPCVSVQYWRDLMNKFSDYLTANDSPDSVVYSIAAGNVENAIQFLNNKGEYKDALAYAMTIGCKTRRDTDGNTFAELETKGSENLVSDITHKLAVKLINHGYTLAACASFLAVDQLEKAQYCLMLGNELEMIACIGMLTNQQFTVFEEAVYYLTKRCEGLNKWELGIRLADLVRNTSLCEDMKIELCSRYPGSHDERATLYGLANLPSFEEAADLASHHLDNGQVVEAVKYFMLATSWEKGFNVGMSTLKEYFTGPLLDLGAVLKLLKWIQCVSKSVMQDSEVVDGIFPNRLDLFAVSSYIGALSAITKGYFEIVSALFRTTINIMKTNPSITLGKLDLEKVKKDLATWLSHYNKGNALNRSELFEELGICNAEMAKGELAREVRVLGSNLPSFEKGVHCWITDKPMQGPVFYLEDGDSVISLNAAIMWNRVNPFSPLHGAYLYAY